MSPLNCEISCFCNQFYFHKRFLGDLRGLVGRHDATT
jgi:hypothetical protein